MDLASSRRACEVSHAAYFVNSGREESVMNVVDLEEVREGLFNLPSRDPSRSSPACRFLLAEAHHEVASSFPENSCGFLGEDQPFLV